MPGGFICAPVLIAALTIRQKLFGSRSVMNLLFGRDPGPA
jgi:hypothetical protein